MSTATRPPCMAAGVGGKRGAAHDDPSWRSPMKITKLETLHCDAGWRVNSFLKISTDEGVTGWSEFMEGYGAQGLATVVEKLGARLIGQDPRPVERHSNFLYAATRQAAG